MTSYESSLRGIEVRAYMVNEHIEVFNKESDQMARLHLLGNLTVTNAEYLELYEKVLK